jgi:hypothetical protein
MREHGTRAKYVAEKCRCEPCRDANRTYARARDRATRRPDEVLMPLVSAGPARRHIAELGQAGVGWRRVAALAGLSTGSVSKLIYGRNGRPPSRRVRRETRDRILAVRASDAAAGAYVDGAHTWQLIEAMLEVGKSKAWIAQHVVGPDARALQLKRHRVTKKHADAVERLARVVLGAPARPWTREDVDELNELYGALADAVDARRQPWRAKASCRAPGVPTEVFFRARGESLDVARGFCSRCPVRAECLASGLSERLGVWGGTSDRERRKLRSEAA